MIEYINKSNIQSFVRGMARNVDPFRAIKRKDEKYVVTKSDKEALKSDKRALVKDLNMVRKNAR